MNIFFTSDTHFSHKTIIDFCNRPFNSVEEMDEALIKNWNSVVSNKDTVYHLGDFCFASPKKIEEIINSLNFDKLFVIRGNHDGNFYKWYKRDGNKRAKVSLYPPYFELKFEDKFFVMSHYPILEWNRCHHGAYHLYGHVHNENPCHEISDYRSMNVGVDVNDYLPVSLESVIDQLKDRKIKGH